MIQSPFSHRLVAAAALALSTLAAPAVHAAVVGQIAAPITFTGNGDNQSTASFSAVQTGDLYIAMTIRLEAGDLGANNFLALWLDNVTTGIHTDRPNIGLKSNEGSPGARDWMVRGSTTGGSYAPDQASIGSTATLWAHLYKASSGSNYNRVSISLAGEQTRIQFGSLIGDERRAYVIDLLTNLLARRKTVSPRDQ